jgi:hypothetical protein
VIFQPLRLRMTSYTAAPVMVSTMKIIAKAFLAGLMKARRLGPM